MGLGRVLIIVGICNVREGRIAEKKIWLDLGTAKGSNSGVLIHDARDLRDTLIERGWELGHDLRSVEDEGAGHD